MTISKKNIDNKRENCLYLLIRIFLFKFKNIIYLLYEASVEYYNQ